MILKMKKFSFLVSSLLFIAIALAANKSYAKGLADAYKDKFYIGTAVSPGSLFDEEILHLVREEFNSITAETNMKLRHVATNQRAYDFNWSDKFVAQGVANNKFVVGHTLVWHKSLADWFFVNPNDGKPLNREQLLNSMRQHIFTFMGRYRGQVQGWDVVNEAFNFDGSFRNSPWLEIIGEDYIEKAFEFAHQADPEAELYYNDYGLVNKNKQDAVVKMIQRLQEKGVPIHGVGIQGHYSLTYPDLERLDNAIARFSELGLKVMITELDVSVLPFPGPEERGEDAEINPARVQELNPYSEGLPEEVMQQLTDRYVDLFCVFLKHRDAVSRVTFWGVTDKITWRNDWPVKGRTDYPLLYDRNMQPKPVVPALVDLATNYQETCAHLWTEKE